MKKITKLLAILLTAAMCFTLLPAQVRAEESTPEQSSEVNLTVFGNSTSSGYGMPDFVGGNRGFSIKNNLLDTEWTYEKATTDNPNREGRMSEHAYPWRLKKYIEQDGSTCNLSAFTMNGMRSDELRAFLDDDYHAQASALEYEHAQQWMDDHPEAEQDIEKYKGFLNVHMEWYANSFYVSGGIEEDSMDLAKSWVKDTIRNSDIIVFDLCGNNFGSYMGYRLASYFGVSGYDRYKSNTYDTINDIGDLPADVRSIVMKAEDELGKHTALLAEGAGRQIIDAYLYSTADTLMNFRADMDLIRGLNPDAKIVAVGLNNPLDGLVMDFNGQKINMGQITAVLNEMVNTYMKAFDKNANHYYYADFSGRVTSFVSSMADANSLEELKQDGALEDGLGAYAIYKMYTEFNNSFLGGLFAGSPEDIYNTLLVPNFAAKGIQLKAWDEMADNEVITGTGLAGPIEGVKMYVTFDFANSDMTKAISADYMGNLHPVGKFEEGNDDQVIYLTKANLAGTIDNIYQMLYDAAHLEAVDFFTFVSYMTNMSAATSEITQYIFGAKDELGTGILSLLDILERYVIATALGEHPNTVGCDEKYQAVLKAYLKEDTAYEESKKEVAAMLEKLAALLDGTPAGEDLAEAMALINKIQKALPMLDEAQEMMAEYKALKAQFEEYFAQALDELGITMDDLAAQAQAIRDAVDVKEIAEYIKVIEEVIRNIPPQEELKEEFEKRLEAIHAIVEERAGEIAEKLYEQIMEINERLKEAVGDRDYDEILKDLEPIYEQLKEIGMAVVNLPEYEKAMDALAETTDKLSQDAAALQDDVNSLKRQVAVLTAKTIDVELEAAVSFPAKTVKTDVSWKADEDAAGYVLKVDGMEAAFTETADGLAYEHTGVKIGQKYTYEVTPYIVADFGGEQETIYGKTFKKVVTPKVKVAKAKIKSVKAAKKAFTAKWKKVTGASGYQLSYKTGKKTKKVLVKGAAKVSKKVKKLQSKKQYTVKVRAYKLVNGRKYWGKWSAGKKVKVR